MGQPTRNRPAKLRAGGRRLWDDITTQWQLRPDELQLLEDCCREVDLIARLQAEVDAGDVYVEGSMGQRVINPAIQEIRQHRNVLKQMLAKLGLPDAPAGSSGSDRARVVAHGRWSRSG